MRKLLNTLYVTTPDAYLSLDGGAIRVLKEEEEVIRVPLIGLESIVTFGRKGVSPALMGECASRGVSLSYLTESGYFLAEVSGMENGNVILRRTQYRMADDESKSAEISRNVLTAKLHNSRWVLERAVRDHAARIDADSLKMVSGNIAEYTRALKHAENLDIMRGIEGKAAQCYFDVFDEMILQSKEDFFFRTRNRRPPTDRVNALLSFAYTLLSNDCAAALRTVGLDPFVGFLHQDRPGRKSLALDIMEELRAVIADRFVLTMINTKRIGASDFHVQENGAVLLKDDPRKAFLKAWQERKNEEIVHPYLQEKIPWGLVPYTQALLLARSMRGDLDGYPAFLWK